MRWAKTRGEKMRENMRKGMRKEEKEDIEG